MQSVNAKINRAMELFKEVNDAYASWQKSNPIEKITQCNNERTEFTLGNRFLIEPELPKWALICGEVLFNLRCALDHIIYYQAVADSGSSPPVKADKLMFPITTSQELFNSAKSRNLTWLSEKSVSLVRSFQPFIRSTNPEEDSLFTLQNLNNIDKHRYLHLACFSVANTDIKLYGFPKGIVKISINEEPLQREDWVISFETAKPCAGPEGEIKYSLRLGIDEERYRKLAILGLIGGCIKSVNEINLSFQKMQTNQ